MLTSSCLWHIIIHIEPVNKSDKNTIPIYKIWTMTNITPKLTGWTFIRVHRLHRTISWQISRKPHEDLQKSLKNIWQRQRSSQARRVTWSSTILPKNSFLAKPHPALDQEESASTSKVHYSLVMF